MGKDAADQIGRNIGFVFEESVEATTSNIFSHLKRAKYVLLPFGIPKHWATFVRGMGVYTLLVTKKKLTKSMFEALQPAIWFHSYSAGYVYAIEHTAAEIQAMIQQVFDKTSIFYTVPSGVVVKGHITAWVRQVVEHVSQPGYSFTTRRMPKTDPRRRVRL